MSSLLAPPRPKRLQVELPGEKTGKKAELRQVRGSPKGTDRNKSFAMGRDFVGRRESLEGSCCKSVNLKQHIFVSQWL